MGKFFLDVDAVEAQIDVINNIANSMLDTSSDVKGVNTADADAAGGFGFGAAKNAIAANIQNASIKMQNATALLRSVVDSHMTVQKSFVYDSENRKGTAVSNASSPSTASKNTTSPNAQDILGAKSFKDLNEVKSKNKSNTSNII